MPDLGCALLAADSSTTPGGRGRSVVNRVAGPRGALWLVLLASTVACQDLDKFRTGEDSVFRGSVVGSDTSGEGSAFRRGFGPGTRLDLSFDPALAMLSETAGEDEPASPGTVSTFDESGEPGRFRSAPLRLIPPLMRDPLSQYDFPGSARVRNYIFYAAFDSTAGTETVERHATVFVSLMEDREIEVRLMAPPSTAPNGDVLQELFGTFHLRYTSAD